jgi:hypothetical protein
MLQPLDIIIVERLGSLKMLSIKDFKQEEVYKKCGFKKAEDFVKQTEWPLKYMSTKYYIQVYAKTDGRANSENKYDFPPPIDKKLFFGSCAILAYIKTSDGTKKYTDLTLPIWEKIYEKLFGGFEDLNTTSAQDEDEEDELEKVPKEKKTKNGYLKDGFVVDSSDAEDEVSDSNSDSEEEDEEELSNSKDETEEEEIILEDIGSELSEESYDYESVSDE